MTATEEANRSRARARVRALVFYLVLALAAYAASHLWWPGAGPEPAQVVVQGMADRQCPDEPSQHVILRTPAGTDVFDRDCVVAPAWEPVELALINPDPVRAHDLVVVAATDGGRHGHDPDDRYGRQARLEDRVLARIPMVTGGTGRTTVAAQPPGTYWFLCMLHPGMRGTYVVR